MRRTEQAQGLRLMKFRAHPAVVLGLAEAAEILDGRSAPSGAGAIALRRKARRVSTTAAWTGSRIRRRAPVDEVAAGA